MIVRTNGKNHHKPLRPKQDIKNLFQEELTKQYIEDDQRRFFNTPNAEADFDYWSKMPHWTLDEALALSFGKNPKIVNWAKLEKILSYTSPFVQEYARIKELASRAMQWQQLFDPVMPRIFVNWVKKNSIKFPENLAEKVENHHPNLVDWKLLHDNAQKQYEALKSTCDKLVAGHNEYSDKIKSLLETKEAYEKQLKDIISNLQSELAKAQRQERLVTERPTKEKPLITRERDTLLKMIIGMAVKGYAYDPNAKKSSSIKDISDDLASLGISLDADTVRKWVKEAAEILPRDET